MPNTHSLKKSPLPLAGEEGAHRASDGKVRALATAILMTACTLPAYAADPAPVAGKRGMVVTAQHIASDIGADIIRQGGNAIDAAVAVGYALAVVYPQAGNIGGGGFLTLHLADGTNTFLDFREKAPLAATATMFQDKDGKIVPGLSTSSWLAAGVPGTVAGLEMARVRYGTMERAALMAPAIKLAREGFVLQQGDVAILDEMAPLLAKDPDASRIFLPAGHPPAPGDRLVQTELADTLATISKDGPQAMYRGPIGAAIAAAVKAGGGIITPEDFAKYGVRELKPVECDYRGFHVISAPPPSSGGVTLCETLQVLQGYDLTSVGFHSAEEVHVLVEALRHTYFDRNYKLGDPDFIKNPVAELLTPDYAENIRTHIEPERATPSSTLSPGAPLHEGSNTTQYSVLDAEGNAVSVTYTLNEWFGSQHVAGHTGIVINDEMDDFTTKIGAPNMFGLVQGANNAIAPGKTPLSSMAPTIVTKNGHVVLVIGSPGGSRIITITLEAIINMIDHGMNVQEAIDAPRIHEQWLPDTVFLEPFALSPDTQKILENDGYTFKEHQHWGVAEGIVTSKPTLTSGGREDQSGALPLGAQPIAGATMFGAHDVRGGAGRASAAD